jgi:lysophospholipase L1-like esterase
MGRRLTRGAALVVLAVLVAVAALELGLQLAARLLAPRRTIDASLAYAPLVVYGDSTPYGLGNQVRFSDEIAREAGVAVANRSWPALNSTQVARIVHDDLATAAPRVLIVMAGVNDGWNVEDVPSELLGPAARWRQRLPRLRTLRLLALGLDAGLGRGEFDAAVGDGWSRREETARLLTPDAIRRILSSSYSSIIADARAHGAEVLFVGYQAEGYNHVGDLAEQVLRAEHGDRLVSVRDLFVDGNGERRMIQDDAFHPTDDGQRAIARRVLEALRSRGWLAGATGSNADADSTAGGSGGVGSGGAASLTRRTRARHHR